MNSPRVRKHISFTPDLWAALEVEAARQNRSVNNLLETIALAAVQKSGETK